MSKKGIWIAMLAVLSIGLPAGCGSGDDDTSTGAGRAADDDSDDGADDSSADDSTDDVADDVADDVSDDTGDDASDDDTSDDDSSGDDDSSDDDTETGACEAYGDPINVGNLGTPDLTEASGLAVSRKNPGVLWAHNDSGDGPNLYAMKMDGSYLGKLDLTGAAASDWEDMAAGPCGDDECLYIGDMGDNGSSRTDARMYRVVEPEIDADVPFGELSIADWDVFPFSYPGGPRDAEALGVHPDGRVYVFSKYPSGTSEMYVFPSLTPDTPVELTYLGDLDTGGGVAATTGADIHPNGRRLILRTYLTVLEWRLPAGEDFDDLPALGARQDAPAPIELQGESIAYVPDDGNYTVTSEGQNANIYRIPCDGR